MFHSCTQALLENETEKSVSVFSPSDDELNAMIKN